jgi:hypothetical protein
MKNFFMILLFIYSGMITASQLELVTTWDKGNGPEGREHSASWINEDHYYVVGGYGFSPFQGVDDHSLWRLDLKTKAWKLLPTAGNPPSSSARSIPLPNNNGVMVMSLSPIDFGRRKITMLHKLEVTNGIGLWQAISIPLVNEVNLEFVKRASNLSSLIYNKNDDSYYSTCVINDCETYRISIQNNTASVEKIIINGVTPSGRLAYSYGFSQKENTMIIASGQMIVDGKSSFSKDVWTLNLATKTWTKFENIMSQKRNPCFSFHENKGELLIWGGTNDGLNVLQEAQVFNLEKKSFSDIYDKKLDVNNRTSCFGAYHPKHGVITGFGNSILNNELKIFLDLWKYE